MFKKISPLLLSFGLMITTSRGAGTSHYGIAIRSPLNTTGCFNGIMTCLGLKQNPAQAASAQVAEEGPITNQPGTALLTTMAGETFHAEEGPITNRPSTVLITNMAGKTTEVDVPEDANNLEFLFKAFENMGMLAYTTTTNIMLSDALEDAGLVEKHHPSHKYGRRPLTGRMPLHKSVEKLLNATNKKKFNLLVGTKSLNPSNPISSIFDGQKQKTINIVISERNVVIPLINLSGKIKDIIGKLQDPAKNFQEIEHSLTGGNFWFTNTFEGKTLLHKIIYRGYDRHFLTDYFFMENDKGIKPEERILTFKALGSNIASKHCIYINTPEDPDRQKVRALDPYYLMGLIVDALRSIEEDSKDEKLSNYLRHIDPNKKLGLHFYLEGIIFDYHHYGYIYKQGNEVRYKSSYQEYIDPEPIGLLQMNKYIQDHDMYPEIVEKLKEKFGEEATTPKDDNEVLVFLLQAPELIIIKGASLKDKLVELFFGATEKTFVTKPSLGPELISVGDAVKKYIEQYRKEQMISEGDAASSSGV